MTARANFDRQYAPFCLFVALCLGSGGATAAEMPEPALNLPSLVSDHDCGAIQCRPPAGYEETLSDGTKVHLTIPSSPYVAKDGTVIAYPGESLTFDFPAAKDSELGPAHLLWVKTARALQVNQVSIFIEALGRSPNGSIVIMLMHRFKGDIEFDVDATVPVSTEYPSGIIHSKARAAPFAVSGAPPMAVVRGFVGPILFSNFKLSSDAARAGQPGD